MKIPFTRDEFLHVFENYNLSVWPMQILLFLLALVTIVLITRPGSQSSRIVSTLLALLWLWMGVVYHVLYFSAINKAAYLFGAVFVVQSLIFLYMGVIKQSIWFRLNVGWTGLVGILLIVYALMIYPAIGYGLGHIFPQSPTFGVPCPTTIFTLGVLLFSTRRVPWFVMAIPVLWSVVGFSAALTLSIKEDFGLVVAGIVSVIILLFFSQKTQTKR